MGEYRSCAQTVKQVIEQVPDQGEMPDCGGLSLGRRYREDDVSVSRVPSRRSRGSCVCMPVAGNLVGSAEGEVHASGAGG